MFGITLCSRSDAAGFWQWVDAASALEVGPSIRAMGYAPHITLSRFREIDPARLTDAMAALDDQAPFVLIFDRLAVFDVAPLVIWLSPRPEERLAALQARLHGLIGPAPAHDAHYAPEAWRPHLTVAMSVPVAHRQKALSFSAQPIEPFDLVFDQIDCVAWPPVCVLASQRLGREQGAAPLSHHP
jgi:hypothetical protein